MERSADRRANTDQQVLAIVAAFVSELDRRLDPPTVTAASRLEEDLGIYSLERLELLLRLESSLGITIPDDAAVGATTVADLAAVVSGGHSESRLPSVDPGRPETSPQASATPSGSLVFTAYVGALLVAVGIVVWPLLHVLRRDRAARLLQHGARFVLRAAGCRPDVSGLQHLAGIGPAVLVANHESYVDCVIMLGTLPIVPNILVNERLPGAPLIGTCVHAAGYLCVDRTSTAARLTCADALVRALRSGESLLVFPEATFPDEPGLLPFRLGAFSAAAAARRPVVPITLRGTRRMLPGEATLLRRSRASVTIHPPLYPTDGGWADALRLRETARAVIDGRAAS